MARQDIRSARTRTALLRAGRELFARQGFADVSTEDIVGYAGVTRGALYHHFADKRALFRAVHEEIEADLAQLVGARIAHADTGNLIEVLAEGIRAFLDACAEPAICRISLIEAPTVLGWTEWRAIEEEHGLGLVSLALQAGMAAGQFHAQPVRPLAGLLLTALSDAALTIANAADPVTTRAELETALLSLLNGLRVRPS